MGTPIYNLPYPTDYTGIADVPEWLKDLADATDAALGDKYTKPSGGIPSTDMTSAVQTSLGKADTAVQDVSGKEDKSNKVTSLSSSSTDTQYPSAKCVYDLVGDIATALDTIQGEVI